MAISYEFFRETLPWFVRSALQVKLSDLFKDVSELKSEVKLLKEIKITRSNLVLSWKMLSKHHDDSDKLKKTFENVIASKRDSSVFSYINRAEKTTG